MKLEVLLIVLFGYAFLVPCIAAEYGIARTSVPVLNTPDFKAVFGGANGHDVKTDRCGQLRELEFVALPGSVFTILKKQRSGTFVIFEVETDEYAAMPKVRLYVDSRFLKLEHSPPASRRPSLPPYDEIISTLRGAVGIPYVWGGNVPNGVPELATRLHEKTETDCKRRLALAGLDCSGLLYHVTGGWTPRNTDQLITFGHSVEIAGKKSAEIAAMLQPLDLIVWKGHVVIVLDQQDSIESRLECGKPGNGGVVTTQLPQRIAEIMRTRRPNNTWLEDRARREIFVVRRWYDKNESVKRQITTSE